MVELEQHCNEKFNMSCIAQLLQGIGFTCATWNLADIDIINIRLFSMYMCRPSQCCVKVLVQLCIVAYQFFDEFRAGSESSRWISFDVGFKASESFKLFARLYDNAPFPGAVFQDELQDCNGL